MLHLFVITFTRSREYTIVLGAERVSSFLRDSSDEWAAMHHRVTAARLSVTYETRFNEASSGAFAQPIGHDIYQDVISAAFLTSRSRGAARRERRNVDGWIIVSIRVN